MGSKKSPCLISKHRLQWFKSLRESKRARFIYRSLTWLLLSVTISLYALDSWISWQTQDLIISDSSTIKHYQVAVVLGTSKYLGRTLNEYYIHRIEAAIKLYRAGKVDNFLLSGDNAHRSYNEPWTMKRDLLNAGVPNSAIHLDYAGFRTLDSIVRAKKIFASDDFLIITQRFHCERALYIAEFHDIKANCLAVSGPTNSYGFKVRLREVFARSKAFLDLYILNAQPKFLGPQEPILTSKEIETVTDEMYSDEMDELDAEERESQENQSDQGIKSDRERFPTQNVDQVLKREPAQQINTEQFFIPESIKRPQP